MESGSENQNSIPNNTSNETGSMDDDVVELGSTDVNKNTTTNKRRLKSDVWNSFEMLPLGSDKKHRCKCKKCGMTYACPSTYGTGNLIKHLEKCVRRDTRDIGQLLITRECGSLNLTTHIFNQEKFRELLVAAIVMHDLPFVFSEYEGMRAVFHYLNNNVQTISRNTCRSDVVSLYKREKEKMKYMLQSTPGRICFTSDLWSSIVTDGYISLTTHFIDKDWNLQKRILNFSFMPPPHNGVSLCEKVYALFLDWGIENKIFSMTLDNASSNASFIGLLISQLNIKNLLISNGEYVHIRCCAHILNLVVQDGLKVIDACIDKIRESIKYKVIDACIDKIRESIKYVRGRDYWLVEPH